MTFAPLTYVGLPPPGARPGPPPPWARTFPRRWGDIASPLPPKELKHQRRGEPRRLALALIGPLALEALRRPRHRRRPSPVMRELAAADEQRFAEQCHQFTGTP